MMKISPDAKTRTMSGGQKQRLITASTLAMKQKIIILDEPLANLDTEGAHILLGALRSLSKSGYAVLLVEHRLDVVRPYVNKVMWIKDKNVTMSADKDAVLRCERVIEPENRPHTVGSPVISGRSLVFGAGGKKSSTRSISMYIKASALFCSARTAAARPHSCGLLQGSTS